MQDMFKGNVSMQDTHTQIMSPCKTLQFRKTCLLSLVGRHDLLKDMSSCLKMHFYCFFFLCFILLKTCLFPRHVLNMAPRHDFYSVMSRTQWNFTCIHVWMIAYDYLEKSFSRFAGKTDILLWGYMHIRCWALLTLLKYLRSGLSIKLVKPSNRGDPGLLLSLGAKWGTIWKSRINILII